jgi:hypothetical protein
MENEVHIHGTMLFLLRKFFVNNYSEEMWVKLNKTARSGTTSYEITRNYPMKHFNAILSAASSVTGNSVNNIKEEFGQYLVPDLFQFYGNYLNPEWKTFEVIENTEKIMHSAVRRLNSAAEPPVLNVSKVNDKLLIIDYYSKRKMASLAVGIVKGIAHYFKEQEYIEVQPTTDLNDERVQIRVSYK